MRVSENFLIDTVLEKNYRFVFNKQKESFFSKIKSSSIEIRIDKLKNIKSWILSHKQEIIDALFKDLRKPEVEVELSEIKPVLWEIDQACKYLELWSKPKEVDSNMALLGTSSKILTEPLGVVLIIAPWNFPFSLTIGPLISAIAAGNCVFIKPSEFSPNNSTLVEKMIKELFEKDEVALFQGNYQVAEELLKLPFNHIFFTGNPEVGKKVMKAAAENLSSVTLELGGCNPAIVDSTVNIKDAAQKVLYGKLLNSGQSCLSVNTVFVEKSVQPYFTKSLLEEFKKMYGLNNSKNKNIGRIINRKHYQRLNNLIIGAITLGAEKIFGGENNEEDNFIAPVILNNLTLSSPILKEEIFGPVLPIVTYENLSEVISYLQSQPSPLALYIFSRDRDTIDSITEQTSSGTICINDTSLQFVHPNLPFGGINHSGIGKAHGYFGFLSFSHQRAVVKQRIGLTTFKFIYPPYTEWVKKIARFISKYF